MNRYDLTNKRFGHLVVIKCLGSMPVGKSNKKIFWLCKCDCGNEIKVPTGKLNSRYSKSCGCARKETLSNMKVNLKHGKRKERIYRTWTNMCARCGNQNEQHYPNYGGRGIKVCDEWRYDFQCFYDWTMSHGYRDDLTTP